MFAPSLYGHNIYRSLISHGGSPPAKLDAVQLQFGWLIACALACCACIVSKCLLEQSCFSAVHASSCLMLHALRTMEHLVCYSQLNSEQKHAAGTHGLHTCFSCRTAIHCSAVQKDERLQCCNMCRSMQAPCSGRSFVGRDSERWEASMLQYVPQHAGSMQWQIIRWA